MGAGSRPALLDARRDSRAARREARRCVRPRLEPLRAARADAPQRGARGWDPRGRGGTRGPRHLPVSSRVRDAMIVDPPALEGSASAQEAGQLFLRPEVRNVLVCESGRLTGIVTRKTLVREVVATGSDPRKTLLRDIAEEPLFTIDADAELDEAFRELEERDFEAVLGQPLLEPIGAL